MTIKSKRTLEMTVGQLTKTKVTKPFLDSSDGEHFFVSGFALFEGSELKAVDYARAPEGDYPFVDKALKNPKNYVLQFNYFEDAPPEILAIIGKDHGPVNFALLAKAITAIETLRPKVWPNSEDPSTVGPYLPQNNGAGYVVQKIYEDGKPAYFDTETEYMYMWVPDKKSAHVFSTYEDAFVFAKRTEGEHARRIRDGKGAARNVSILPAE